MTAVAIKQKPKQKEAIALRLKGLTYAEIGAIMGCSRQGVQQLVRPPKPIYEFVKERANGQCQGCGIKLENGHIHHRTSNVYDDYNDINNLIYVCIPCHQTGHATEKRIKLLEA